MRRGPPTCASSCSRWRARSGTILSGAYQEYADTRFIMPPVRLGSNPFANKLCFYHWFRIGPEDHGDLVIRTWLGNAWGPWQTLQDSPGPFVGIGANWTSVCVLPPASTQLE